MTWPIVVIRWVRDILIIISISHFREEGFRWCERWMEVCISQLLYVTWTMMAEWLQTKLWGNMENKKREWHIETRTKGKREHYKRPGSAFRNVTDSGWWAVSVVRSLELPPSFRGPREERGVTGETGSPGPGFDWLKWTCAQTGQSN